MDATKPTPAEGYPDHAAREAEIDKDLADVRHRFAFHAAPDEEKRMAHTSVRDNCLELAEYLVKKLPPSRERSLALTNLEQVMFWGNAALAREK